MGSEMCIRDSKIGLRVPDEVRRRDGAMIPLREHVKHCSCPDFTKRYLVQGMNTPWQTPDAVTQPWCKHIATAMWVIASDYRVVFSEDIRVASSAAPAAGAGALSIRDASDAASAAASGVLGRLDTQTTAIEETELEVQPPRDRELSVQHATVEAMYFVRLRERGSRRSWR